VMQRRNEYLSATAEIGRLVTSTLDMTTLFSRTVNLVRDRFGFYHAGIFVTEETGFKAILQAATGEAGAEMMRQKHSLQVGSKSIVGEVTESGQPVVVNDTAASAVHKFNPLLPETRAETAIPLRVGTRIIGALDIQSTSPNAFSEDDIAVLQTLTDQIAIAIDNARSYELSMQAVKEIREADKLKSQFLANMSHELRTPLNSIIGFSRVILKGIDGPTTDLQQQDLLAIHNSGQHLLGLINDILDISRIEAGKMELTFDEVNLPDLITSVMSTVTGLVKDKSITLHRDLPADLPTVRADAMRIRQVLLNLLSNAAKFTDEGAITVRASVGDSPSGHPEITVSVTDSGQGISPEDQKKLFQPFSQVDSSATRKSGGSGLGLSISNHLVEMHGGRIGVESATGAGSTFYFTLPAFRGKSEADITHGNKIILAIDDDPQVVSLYERYLQPQGYQVVALSDPSRAVERVRQLKPYAVTLDIMMPGYDGWRVLNELKSDASTRDIPVIVCSIVEEHEKGFSLGAADYLVKPILEDDILNALDRLNIDGSIREVLIIDDDPNDLRLMGRMLSEHGRYQPTLVEGGRNGWESILVRMPHAVVLDLFMPEMDGFTIIEKMRSNEKLRDVPVVVVSGGDLTAEQQQKLQDFGQRMIQKNGLNEKQLIGSLERVLKRVKK
jgi:signal transduction histidine kinase/CheY-like chemotaxis protein